MFASGMHEAAPNNKMVDIMMPMKTQLMFWELFQYGFCPVFHGSLVQNHFVKMDRPALKFHEVRPSTEINLDKILAHFVKMQFSRLFASHQNVGHV